MGASARPVTTPRPGRSHCEALPLLAVAGRLVERGCRYQSGRERSPRSRSPSPSSVPRCGAARAGRPGPWQDGWQWHRRCHLVSSEHPRSWWVRGRGGTVDITQLILDDHHEQRRLFAILEQVGRADTGVLAAVWARVGAFLELHAAAEEAIFYPALLQVGLATGRRAGAEGETLDAIRDHNDIRDAVAEVAHHRAGSDAWFAAVAAANLANSDHMAEEEREGLTDFRRLSGLQQRHDLAVAFAAFQARNFAGVPAVDRDPERYIREAEQDYVAPAEQDPRPRPTGSLDIGSLKGQ